MPFYGKVSFKLFKRARDIQTGTVHYSSCHQKYSEFTMSDKQHLNTEACQPTKQTFQTLNTITHSSLLIMACLIEKPRLTRHETVAYKVNQEAQLFPQNTQHLFCPGQDRHATLSNEMQGTFVQILFSRFRLHFAITFEKR